MKDEKKEIDWIKEAYKWANEQNGRPYPRPEPPRSEIILWAAFQQAEWDKRELTKKNKELLSIFYTAFEAFQLLIKE